MFYNCINCCLLHRRVIDIIVPRANAFRTNVFPYFNPHPKVVGTLCAQLLLQFLPILLKLYSCFENALKMCMWFGYNPQIVCHLFHNPRRIMIMLSCFLHLDDITSMRLPPASPNPGGKVRIKDVVVTAAEEGGYLITFYPFNCGRGFQLLGIMNGQVRSCR